MNNTHEKGVWPGHVSVVSYNFDWGNSLPHMKAIALEFANVCGPLDISTGQRNGVTLSEDVPTWITILVSGGATLLLRLLAKEAWERLKARLRFAADVQKGEARGFKGVEWQITDALITHHLRFKPDDPLYDMIDYRVFLVAIEDWREMVCQVAPDARHVEWLVCNGSFRPTQVVTDWKSMDFSLMVAPPARLLTTSDIECLIRTLVDADYAMPTMRPLLMAGIEPMEWQNWPRVDRPLDQIRMDLEQLSLASRREALCRWLRNVKQVLGLRGNQPCVSQLTQTICQTVGG